MTDDELRPAWIYEVATGDTSLGFEDWKRHQDEMNYAEHVEFFVEVRVPTVPPEGWEERIKVLETAIYHICHDNLDDLDIVTDDGENGGEVMVHVHRAPVPKDGPNHWEGVA
jgi:hypothetical protein